MAQTPEATREQLGTVRVDITHQAQKSFEAIYKSEDQSFRIAIDEPTIRGGQNQGPSPLGYFVTGAASCLAMQYMNVMQERPLPLESMKVLARAHNDRQARVFTDMVFQVSLTGPISPADAEALARDASKRCFVENTLEKAIPITTEVSLNGEPLVTLARVPSGSPG
ncbi:MAG: OsmC-like protein [Chloroflexi bacterium]|nr:OsmC-like protein [Chloroflexota bacterium]